LSSDTEHCSYIIGNQIIHFGGRTPTDTNSDTLSWELGTLRDNGTLKSGEVLTLPYPIETPFIPILHSLRQNILAKISSKKYNGMYKYDLTTKPKIYY